ncbi:MAG: hypothetical protein E6K80_12060 [Candidatus Eisenbacteria bacterium]|uniref:Uncharacterized protein n=1 Tax=Eiseniibacteriota bacterium TaxID=2212470 RepID=A0A538U0B1_UNCEI|nr:MAG: hypothetical protein E6K80_12060 [Candidatus Eisenbacteria bacterium]
MRCRIPIRSLVLASLGLGVAIPGFCQGSDAPIPQPAQLIQITTPEVTLAAGGQARARVTLTIARGWHVNANPPVEDMIPTQVDVESGAGITAEKAIYPAPKKAKLSFDERPLLVWDETATIEVPLAAAASSAPGRRSLGGKLRFQACNDQVCLPPATVTFQIPVAVSAGANSGPSAAGTTSSSAPSEGSVAHGTAGAGAPAAGATRNPSATTAPAPAGGGSSGTTSRRLEAALASGGLMWFLALFVGGLVLNLTPCVFPMLGVTVSIFGARRQEPLPKVVTAAALYVLGIVVMYSTLGVIAALTGSASGSARCSSRSRSPCSGSTRCSLRRGSCRASAARTPPRPWDSSSPGSSWG